MTGAQNQNQKPKAKSLSTLVAYTRRQNAGEFDHILKMQALSAERAILKSRDVALQRLSRGERSELRNMKEFRQFSVLRRSNATSLRNDRRWRRLRLTSKTIEKTWSEVATSLPFHVTPFGIIRKQVAELVAARVLVAASGLISNWQLAKSRQDRHTNPRSPRRAATLLQPA